MKITRASFNDLMFPCYTPMDMLVVRGSGSYLYDDQERSYLDLTAGIAVNAFGHCDPGVVQALTAQASTLMHTSNIFTNPQTLQLAATLERLTGFERAFFVNSGAEANETALKLARRVAFDIYGADKDEIISFNDSFHGRTFFSVTVGGHEDYSAGFGPRPGAITHLPYNDVEALKKAVSDRTCCVMLEPIQGEGGIHPATDEFMRTVRELCDRHHALLIFDEVQTGVGRTGTLYAYEQYGIRPDILTSAKALAAGLPIGAVLTTRDIAAHFGPGTHGSTFGGNALAAAMGNYTLDRLINSGLIEQAAATGKNMVKGLQDISVRNGGIFTEVRGRGLLIGAELNPELKLKAADVQKECFAKGLLILTAGATVLRFTPPLNLSSEDLQKALTILDAVMAGHRL